MQTAPAVIYEHTARHMTLATHKQAVERAIQVMHTQGWYLFHDVPDGIYHLRAAAFPVAADLHSSLLPGEKLLLGNNASRLVFHQGRSSGNPHLVLHTPPLTDPPLVMGLPLL